MNHCVLSANGNDNTDADPNNIIFTIKGTKLYMYLLLLYQQKTIKSYQNFLAKDLKDQCIGMNIKQKVRIKIQQTIIEMFLNQTL